MTELDTAPVVWPSWCYATENNNESESVSVKTEHSVTGRSGTPSGSTGGGRQRKKKTKATNNNSVNGVRMARQMTMANEQHLIDSAHSAQIKAERFSPDIGGECSSRSVSSGSPASPSRHPRPPSYPGTPPTVPMSAPIGGPERFSPAAATGIPGATQPLKQMEQMMSRNYSDFMRSLAAKYNNSNPQDYFNNSRNGFLTGLDSRFSFKPGSSPLLGLTPFATPLPTKDLSELKKSDIAPLPPAPLIPPNFNSFSGMIDMSSTQALLNMVRSASAQSASQLESYNNKNGKRPHEIPSPSSGPSSGISNTNSSPLDLSSVSKKPRGEANRVILRLPNPSENDKSKELKCTSPKPPSRPPSLSTATTFCQSLCTDTNCMEDSPGGQQVAQWNVDDVCSFISSIDLCAEYVEMFRCQSIDGAALALLTEEHLTNKMNMKLGPALKLRSVLAKRIGHCALCMHCVHCHGVTKGTANIKEIEKRSPSGKEESV